jgi:hypothetical protein
MFRENPKLGSVNGAGKPHSSGALYALYASSGSFAARD